MPNPVKVHVHLESDVEPEPYVTGEYAWVACGSVNLHCYTPEAADRLAEAARDLAATMRLRGAGRAA